MKRNISLVHMRPFFLARNACIAAAMALSMAACGESELELFDWSASPSIASGTSDAGTQGGFGGSADAGQTCTPGMCGVHGVCDDSSGSAPCICDQGYRGAKCDYCASGYTMDDDGVSCVAIDDLFDAGATPTTPDAGVVPAYDAGSGGTVKTCASTGLDCGSHGTCMDGSGSPYCSCDAGWAGSNCQRCATGYQSSGSGQCLATCATAGLNCGAHGTCNDSSGTAACVCETGYSGASCDACASGWQDNDGNGTCTKGCSLSGLNCGSHGSCTDASGTPKCTCETGYSGTTCASCASGYQDNDGNGTCLKNCATAGLSCSTGQACDDSSGTAKCVTSSNTDEWTFMVYLDGDNNLDGNASTDLNEMKKGLSSAGTSKKVNVIVLHDGDGASDTKLYKVTESGLTTLNSGTAIFSGSEADMSSADTLKKFGVWAVKNYPAKKYALIMWDHGGGWRDGEGENTADSRHCGCSFSLMGAVPADASAYKGFSQDDNSADSSKMITLADGAYGGALSAIKTQAGQKLSIIGFDACLMGMYEVGAASAAYGDYLVASAESEPGSGWDYKAILKALATTPTMNALTLSKEIVDSYNSHSSYSATLAVFDLSKVSAMTTALGSFGSALKTAIATSSYKSAIKTIRSNTQQYGYQEHIDLKHFATQVSTSSSLPSSVKTAASSVLTNISSYMVYAKVKSAKSYWGYSHDNASGIAVFFPEAFDCKYWGEGYVPYSADPCKDSNNESGWYLKTTVTSTSGEYRKAGWCSNWGAFLGAYY